MDKAIPFAEKPAIQFMCLPKKECIEGKIVLNPDQAGFGTVILEFVNVSGCVTPQNRTVSVYPTPSELFELKKTLDLYFSENSATMATRERNILRDYENEGVQEDKTKW